MTFLARRCEKRGSRNKSHDLEMDASAVNPKVKAKLSLAEFKGQLKRSRRRNEVTDFSAFLQATKQSCFKKDPPPAKIDVILRNS
jgi:hypothetical protein